ncbi:bifunctional DNA primase/polymerase [Dietzia cercidiphylli]|uniref:bifunctional DNA primase/polymerase n=1 Tax=Dietzia cercidiphylli TaxID=498199 RepID=UPI00223B369A|nr:bifunctional DNA primase/polymerase [Dietzia cercidiphylli]MCT1516585.1 bifunctional DNA primase/polymerase [Dietzia cercidiphylli]
MQTSDFLTAAMEYARQGLPVLPLTPGRKTPATVHGSYDATCDPEQICAWWSANDYNVGVTLPEGLIVIDVDPRNGGTETIERLTQELGPLGNQPRVVTGSNGWHIWCQTTTHSTEMRGKLGPGVDLKRGPRSYVVAPPSVHPDTGWEYEWWNPDSTALFLPEAWELTVRLPQRPRRRPGHFGPGEVSGVLRWFGESVEGERNERLYWAAIRVLEQGSTDDETRLIAVADSLGLDPGEISRTIESARGAACLA